MRTIKIAAIVPALRAAVSAAAFLRRPALAGLASLFGFMSVSVSAVFAAPDTAILLQPAAVWTGLEDRGASRLGGAGAGQPHRRRRPGRLRSRRFRPARG